MFHFLTILLCFLMMAFGAGNLRAADGKSLFKQNKCTKCHTFKSAGLLKVVKEATDEDEVEDEDVEEEEDPPDLSKLSDKVLKDKSGLTPEEHIKKFLKKQIRHGTKKHKNLFKGSDGDLDALVKFILKPSGK